MVLRFNIMHLCEHSTSIVVVRGYTAHQVQACILNAFYSLEKQFLEGLEQEIVSEISQG